MDVVVAVLLSLVQAALGGAGVALALKTWTDRARRHFAFFFVLLSLSGIVLVAWQATRAARSSEESRKNMLGDAEHPPSLDVISMPGFTRFVINNASDYPAYGIKVRLYDDADKTILRTYDYPEIAAHVAFMDDKPWIPPDGAGMRHFTVSITTRTGLVYEELILRPAGNNQWMRASRVRQGMRTLEEDVDSSWPRDQNGQVEWN